MNFALPMMKKEVKVLQSETEIEMLPALTIGSKMIFPNDHTLIKNFIPQDAKISKITQEKLKCLFETLKTLCHLLQET